MKLRCCLFLLNSNLPKCSMTVLLCKQNLPHKHNPSLEKRHRNQLWQPAKICIDKAALQTQMVTSQHGMFTSQPWMVGTSTSRMLTSQPGMLTSQPGMVTLLKKLSAKGIPLLSVILVQEKQPMGGDKRFDS